jgi:hypothetical protein
VAVVVEWMIERLEGKVSKVNRGEERVTRGGGRMRW